MTYKERFEILWRNHIAHIDEHRAISRLIERLEEKITYIHYALNEMAYLWKRQGAKIMYEDEWLESKEEIDNGAS